MAEKKINEMTVEEIVTRFLQDRGLDPKNQKFRAEYPPDLVERARKGDGNAIMELLRIEGVREMIQGQRGGSDIPSGLNIELERLRSLELAKALSD